MPVITNDYRVDAVLAGNDIRWGEASQGNASAAMTFSFMSALPTYADPAVDGNNFSVMTGEQKSAIRKILTMLSSQFDLVFTEVTDSGSSYGQLRFGNNAQGNTVGYAYYPDTSLGDNAGDLYINNVAEASQTTGVIEGSNAYSTLIHEIGHTLGLKHPGDYNAAEGADSSANEGPFLTGAEDSELYSIMSYTQQSQGLERISLAPYDYAALSYLYNAKPINTGDDVYTLTDQSGRYVQTIFDSDGIDTLDASGMHTPVTLNLNAAAPGTLSSAGLTSSGQAAVNNLSLGLNTAIERARGGSADDKLIANSGDNVLSGNAGNDILVGQLGSDTMIGGAGSDIFGLTNVGYFIFQDFVPGVDKVAFNTQLGIQNFDQLAVYITGVNVQNNDIVVNFVDNVASITFVGVMQQSTALSVSDVVFQVL
jgi:Ca2+-binding RTX toxin-like protein